ncbi:MULTISPECIES: SDR family oxidoreductase [Bacillus]|uniref:Oxidoreductase n=2 Tax=Bacillus TaxID=1386 RepID=A0A0M4FLH1_9BACI|nr:MULTISPECIES: SDR family oxidoreductase [Bacillus]ALC82891.1 oxidoreductase [Bacillus gobiensis]MBP1081866.1 3-oxoacyl-[acyl-carrier protein] reductase [Bacillus capparidis]MED1096515.1 SDR family oxidoreductase [Bacillus capparidis]
MNKGKKSIAVVTGVSHPKGIGAAICRKLASVGTDIFFTHWSSEVEWSQSFLKEIKELGVRCEGLEIDLSDVEASVKLLDTVTAELDFPSILVNNAAHSVRDGYEHLDAKTLDEHYSVNMRAAFLLSVEFARRFKKLNRSSGRIINMTSGQDIGPMREELAYAATKGAISAFTRSLSAELAPLGITVNAVNPGPTDSGWMTEEIKQVLSPNFLLGRVGKPDDAARLVAFLASEEAGWITGQVIHSEGGFLRS